MNSNDKFTLIDQLKILNIAAQTQAYNYSKYNQQLHNNIKFAQQIGGLLEGIGLELIDCCRDDIEGGEVMTMDCLDVTLPYFGHIEFIVSHDTTSFILAYFNMVCRSSNIQINSKIKLCADKSSY